MRVSFTLILCVLLYCVHAQKSSPFTKFGKISPADLERKIYPVDSQANAIVLSDIGKAGIEGNSKGWFSLVSTHHRVVHILNKNGYDMANVSIRLYGHGGNSEKLESIKAVTYNLENGKIVETRLEKGSIFTEKIDRNWSLRKFTMPNVREGSIIEFEYKIVSDYIRHLEPWYFQGSAPRLWSEFVFSAPAFFTYSFIRNGYHPLYLEDRKDRAGNFGVTIKKDVGISDVEENIVISSGISDYRWIMTDVPELKPERFTSTVQNHISKIEFQLVSQSEPLAPHNFVLSWKDLTKELLNSEHFGSLLQQYDNWTNSDLKQVGLREGSERQQALKCFNYIRDTYSWTDKRGIYMDRSMREVVKTKKGSVPELNILLTGLLKYSGLNAEPVILSTTDHGYVYENYPSLASFNYVICRVVADGKTYYLDVSNRHLGFGKLDPSLYNGNAIVVNEEATVVKLSADSLAENKKTLILVSGDETGKWVGKLTQTLGDYESYLVRKQLAATGMDGYFEELKKTYGADFLLSSLEMDSLDNLEVPVTLRYTIEMKRPDEGLIYLNPLLGEAMKDNPFKSIIRHYPVEMPYRMNDVYILTLEVPAGYKVDELPKQIVAKMDTGESAYFEYRITQSGNTISLRSRVSTSRTIFHPDEYVILREFFNLIVKKQNEQIVFKKLN